MSFSYLSVFGQFNWQAPVTELEGSKKPFFLPYNMKLEFIGSFPHHNNRLPNSLDNFISTVSILMIILC